MKNMDSKDKKILLRGRRIAEQVLSVFRNQQNDTSDLDAELKNNPYFKSYIDKITDEQQIKTICENYRRRERQSEVQRFTTTILEKKKRSNRRKIVLFSSSVAALLLISLSIFYSNKSDETVNTAANPNENPEQEIIKPTLIVGNNEIVALEKGVKVESDMSVVDEQSAVFKNINNTVADNTELKIVIPSKYIYFVTLPDGTKVTLNANSSLRFPKEFSKTNRTVYLEGEAYFDVAKSDIPFYVSCDCVKLRVYGTQFNVNTKNNMEIVLIEGSVGIGYKEKSEIMLKPNQRVFIDTKSDNLEIEDIDAAQYIGWMNNSFQCNNGDILRIIKDIENWYGIKIDDRNHKLEEGLKIDFCVNRTASVDKIITLLEETLNILIINEGGGNYRIK